MNWVRHQPKFPNSDSFAGQINPLGATLFEEVEGFGGAVGLFTQLGFVGNSGNKHELAGVIRRFERGIYQGWVDVDAVQPAVLFVGEEDSTTETGQRDSDSIFKHCQFLNETSDIRRVVIDGGSVCGDRWANYEWHYSHFDYCAQRRRFTDVANGISDGDVPAWTSVPANSVIGHRTPDHNIERDPRSMGDHNRGLRGVGAYPGSGSGGSGMARLEIQQESLSDAKQNRGYREYARPEKHLPLYVYLLNAACAFGLIAVGGWNRGRTGLKRWDAVAACGVCLLLSTYALLLSGY